MNNPQYFNSCVFVCVFLPNICDLKAAQWYNSRSLVWLAKGWDKIKTKDDNDNDSGNNKAIICWSWSCQWSLANTFWGIWIDCWSNNSKSLIFTFFLFIFRSNKHINEYRYIYVYRHRQRHWYTDSQNKVFSFKLHKFCSILSFFNSQLSSFKAIDRQQF